MVACRYEFESPAVRRRIVKQAVVVRRQEPKGFNRLVTGLALFFTNLKLVSVIVVLLALAWMVSPWTINHTSSNDNSFSLFGGQTSIFGFLPDASGFGATSQNTQSADDNIVRSPSITVAQINHVLAAYSSPAQGKGQILYDLGVQYGIDPAFALAFFVHESDCGTRGVAVTTHNLGNIRATSGNPSFQGFRLYSSWEEGFEDWYKLIRNLYVAQWGKTTVSAIIPTYAPSSDHNNVSAYIHAVDSMVAYWHSQNTH